MILDTLVPDSPAAAVANTSKINAELAAMQRGVVRLPAGVFFVAPTTTSAVCLFLKRSNVSLAGEGRYATTLRLPFDIDAHLINVVNVRGVTVSGLEVDGSQTPGVPGIGHGIRGENWSDGGIDDVWVHDTPSYGIGCQEGVFDNFHITNFEVGWTGVDGVDFKDLANANVMTVAHGLIHHWGLATADRKNGLDVRGRATVYGMRFYGLGNRIALNLRPGAAGATNHRADYSLVDNIRIVGEGVVGSVGVSAIARQCVINNVQIDGCATGIINPLASGNAASGIIVRPG